MQTSSHEKCSYGHAPHARSWLFWLAVALCSATLQPGGALAELTTVHSFGAPKGYALSELCEGAGGTFYATATKGGRFGLGAVLRFSRFGDLTVLHSFDGSKGSAPVAGLARGRDGNFYGSTTGGGAFGHGTLFRMTPSGSITTLHSFALAEGGGPLSPLLLANDGNFYGSTVRVAVFDETLGYAPYLSYGALFRLAANGTVTILHTFSATDGSGSVYPLLQARDGNLYGSTPTIDAVESSFHPGFVNYGTLFRLTLSGAFTTLFDFANSETDAPLNLVELDDGYLYGSATGVTAWMSEPSPPMFFRISLAGAFEPLRTGGDAPAWELAFAPDGGLLGVGARSVVRISRRGRVTPFVQFDPEDGTWPMHITRTATGALYGTSESTFFRIAGREALVLARVSYPLGAEPRGALIRARDGNFYGVTGSGGEEGFGTIYRMNPRGDVTRVCSLQRNELASELLEARDGALYYAGYSSGIIGRTTKRGALSSVYGLLPNFSNPLSPLVQGPDGALYGIAQSRGEIMTWSAFRVTTRGAATVPYALEDLLASFGIEEPPLALGDERWLYRSEGDQGSFAIRTTAAGVVSGLYTFPSAGGAGAALVIGPDGSLYGTTPGGAPPAAGAIFRIAPDGARSNLYAFDRNQGYWPQQELTIAADGTLYGVTSFGPGGAPTIYRVTPDGTHTQLHSFQGSALNTVPSALTLDDSGALYGTLSTGGAEGVGSIFRIDPP